ncbi:MAG: glycine cleavage system protein GcvH [Pirellulales bacterium]|nr:glycine cleavage system protein GcvH [Planctomycetales bacterium]
MKPDELQFATTHEWVHVDEVDGGRVATVGISAFAVEALTDLVFIDLPEVGRNLDAGEAFGEIESVKAVSDLYAPAAGEVVEVNSAVVDDLDQLKSDPFGGGWLVKIRLADDADLGHLLDYAAYQKQCAEESH